MKKLTRRQFLLTLPFLGSGALAAASFLEPHLLRTTHLDMRELGLGKRIVHFSDLHFKGNYDFARSLAERIHLLEPDYIVFTGDLVEHQNRTYFEQALQWLSEFKVPTYGVPGNHDPMDSESLSKCRKAYAATGGRFLFGERVELDGFVLHGNREADQLRYHERVPKFLLCHYPIVGEQVMRQPYALILAGHSHGGQVRLPLIGPLILPPGVGRFDRGYFETTAGKLYVNVGAGTFLFPVRLFCRPEVTEILI
ncbi:MAG: metallophosphoesterase [Opitutales bacterium]